MSALFLLFVAAVGLMLVAAVVRYLPKGHKAPALIGLAVWLAYGAALGYGGVIANADLRPPGLFYLLAPMIMFVMFMARSAVGHLVALSFPIWLLLGAQSFRLVVEVFLHGLWLDARLPTMMTFHGANFDILIGMSAPLMAWLVVSRKVSDRVALGWNAVGIAMLANVAVRGVLTTPGPLHLISTEVPNAAIGAFPFSYIPGLMVPLALVLHVLSIRSLRQRISDAASGLSSRSAPTRVAPARQGSR